MRIAVLGGGFSGLSAAYDLLRKGHEVTLFEKEKNLGGLASGFKVVGWTWYLERTYHHLFSNDTDILTYAREIDFNDIFFRSPETASLYNIDNNYRIFPLDTPQDFLRFPLLSWPVKIRSAAVLAFLKYSPFLSAYERQTAEKFLKNTMGEKAWNVLWEQLFRKKFGKYAEKIVVSFFWARITKRTKDLGYVRGGFQTFIDHAGNLNRDLGMVLKNQFRIQEIGKKGNVFTVNGMDLVSGKKESGEFDAVISTLPTPVQVKITANLFPADFIKRLEKIEYLHAVSLILETEEPFLDKTYWLNICDSKLPLMVAVQHTNFMDKAHYGDHHILYIGNYVDAEDPRLRMDARESLEYYLPHFSRINPAKSMKSAKLHLFKAAFAQPIFDREFVTAKPEFETPVKGFYIANLDMTYPYDRGTNYAVKLGREVSKIVQ